MVIDLTIEPEIFVDQLFKETVSGGLTVVDAVERILGEQMEFSISEILGDYLVRAPRSKVHPHYYWNRFENLAALSQVGYSTWYPEVRFSTHKNDSFQISDIHAHGIVLGNLFYGGNVKRNFDYKQKMLKTQVNHVIRFNHVTIPRDIFKKVLRRVSTTGALDQPYIANLTVGCRHFVDDRIAGYRTVAFDHVVTGQRKFCRCHANVHAEMLSDARSRAPLFVADSWPHLLMNTLEQASYEQGLCHFCVSSQHGEDACLDWYGSQIRERYGPYVDFLMREKSMDVSTAKSEAKRRLSISRWIREDELYRLMEKLFPANLIKREASPSWLGRQRLDVFLPELGFAVEHQGEQHFRPIRAFGGERGFEKTRERDVRKRALCNKNGVKVIDIRFDEPLTLTNLRHRLEPWL